MKKKTKLDKIAKLLGASRVVKLKTKAGGPLEWIAQLKEVQSIMKELKKYGIVPKGYNLKSPYDRR